MGEGIKWYDEAGTITPEQFKASVSGTTKAELFARYMDAKAERDEARALVRELVEALEAMKLKFIDYAGDTGYYVSGGGLGDIEQVKQAEAALTRAREAGYGKETG